VFFIKIKLVDVNNLSISIGKEKLIKNLSLELENKTISCIVAPNGTGKTTFFKALANILPIDTGTIIIDSIPQKFRIKYNKNIFFLENSDQLFPNLTTYENIKYIAELWGNECDIQDIINLVGVNKYKNKKTKYLSLGMKQKVLIAVAISSGAKVLIFDEPLNGLDIENVETISNVFITLKKMGKTLILSSHNIFEISKLCDNIFFLTEGNLTQASLNYDNLKEQYKTLFYEEGTLK